MENHAWRFGVVANIADFHTGEDGVTYRGTKPFTAGTKVYLAGKNWDVNYSEISVIGRNRFGRIVLESIPIDCLENLKTQRIYKPHVLKIIDYLEVVDGWIWWSRTSEDRKDATRFVQEWNKRLK